MAKDSDAEQRALADRLVNYADAMVALSVVGTSGLGVAIAEPDARESVASGATYIIVANMVIALIFSGLVEVLRRWEADLREDLPPVPKARKYARYLHVARLVVIWIAAFQTVGLMVAIR